MEIKNTRPTYSSGYKAYNSADEPLKKTNQEIEKDADQTEPWEDGTLYCPKCGSEISTESFDAYNHLKLGYFSGTCECGVEWEIALSVKNSVCDLATLILLWEDGNDIFTNINKSLFLV